MEAIPLVKGDRPTSIMLCNALNAYGRRIKECSPQYFVNIDRAIIHRAATHTQLALAISRL